MAESFLDAGVQVLVKALDDVSAFMDLTALDRRGGAEGPADRLGEGFRPIDNEQPGDLGLEAAVGRIVEQGLHGRGVLGCPFGDPQHVLVALAVDPDRRDQEVVADLQAVQWRRWPFMGCSRARSKRSGRAEVLGISSALTGVFWSPWMGPSTIARSRSPAPNAPGASGAMEADRPGPEARSSIIGCSRGVLVAPGHNRALPLAPGFITPQDGAEKQDRESRAARRWLASHGPGLARPEPVYLGDDLYSRQPFCEAVRALEADFLFVAKPGPHPTLMDWPGGIEPPSCERRVKKGRRFQTHRFRWLEGVPIRDGKDALTDQLAGNGNRQCQRQDHLSKLMGDILVARPGHCRRDRRLAPARGGRSRTKASTSSKPRATTLGTTSDTARTAWPPSWQP